MMGKSKVEKGKLFICPTPIGNLKDITLRVLETLKEVDLIAAEDTRETRKLLTHFGIKVPITSYHEHNEATKGKELLDKLLGGEKIALVSDAGMPGLADPGHRLIKACIEKGIEVEVLPGPSAFVTALVASGLPTDSFVYQGFLPRKKRERIKLLKELVLEKRTLIFYETPHRLEAALGDVLAVLGVRKMALARELTKKFEEIVRGNSSEVLEVVKSKKPKGEMVLIVEGAKAAKKEFLDEAYLRKQIVSLINKGLTKKEALKKIAEEEEVPKRMLYELVKEVRRK
ncbi:MAG: 16S rRNA (cytidine(1402)-2'-O)-methyltransferase [Candidatus Subteraquimicrobiales bacterium]|nr:16S rRNA (cytidine(1402)-2'-O)-methyltransferase [Candidatus Subteraquimicrobiales bacterium]